MNKHRKKAILTIGMLLCLAWSSGSVQAAEPETRQEVKTYEVQDPDGVTDLQADLPSSIQADGKTWSLVDCQYETLKKKAVTEDWTLTIEVISDWILEDYIPPETIEKDGKVYTLAGITETLQPKERTIQATAETVYPDVISKPDIPLTCDTTIYDELLQADVSVTLPLSSVTNSDYQWVNDFTFTLTVQDVSALYYELGGDWIDSDQVPDLGYAPKILAFLDLSTEVCRISSMIWDGAAYQTADGRYERTITGSGSRYVTTYTATYVNTVSRSTAQGKVYTVTYNLTEPIPTGETVYTIQATGIYRLLQSEEAELPTALAAGTGGAFLIGLTGFVYRAKKARVYALGKNGEYEYLGKVRIRFQRSTGEYKVDLPAKFRRRTETNSFRLELPRSILRTGFGKNIIIANKAHLKHCSVAAEITVSNL